MKKKYQVIVILLLIVWILGFMGFRNYAERVKDIGQHMDAKGLNLGAAINRVIE